MAQYTICTLADGFDTTEVTIYTNPSNCSFRTYNQDSCVVVEHFKNLVFRSSTIPEIEFTVYYSYDISYYQDLEFQETLTQQGLLLFPAGQRYHSVEVLCDVTESCGDAEDGGGSGIIPPEYPT